MRYFKILHTIDRFVRRVGVNKDPLLLELRYNLTIDIQLTILFDLQVEGPTYMKIVQDI